MQPIRRIALDRRTFLRGAASACVALPWLDAMAPALSAAPPEPVRALFVFAPNGVNVAQWQATGLGPKAQLGATLQPLHALRARATVFSGLGIDAGRAHGDGPGDHARAAASFLTCAHPRKTGGEDLQCGVSIDQVIAASAGRKTAFASLQLGLERGRAAGVCDSGYSCAYSNNVSWRAPDLPLTKETDPRAVFARLFGDPADALDARQRRREVERDRSVLDLVLADAKGLRVKLGADDQRKLDQYLQSVRELEKRLELPREDTVDAEIPDGLLAAQMPFPERLRLMYELVRLAFATDRTRVISLMLGNGGSQRSYRFLGVPEGHHSLSHHGKVPKKLAAIAKIDRFHVEQLAAFLSGLAAEQAGDADLLARSMVVYGSGIRDGNRHDHHNLPVLLAGEGGGAAVGRGHVVVPKKTPMANLYLGVARAMGSSASSFADSTDALVLS